MYKIASFFSGAGGLDLGFKSSGFSVVYANEYDRNIWDTYEINHPSTQLDKRTIVDIRSVDVPNCDGIIGGPPCQSWSEAGSQRGIYDHRGRLFFDFIRILKDKQPMFFLVENVSGMLAPKHNDDLDNIKETFSSAGYDLFFRLLNATDFGVAQDRKRIIFIGFRKDLNVNYQFPKPVARKKYLKDVIKDLDGSATPALEKQKANTKLKIANNEYMTGGFSPMYMSRNRVRTWDEHSFTIQAGGRHAPIHPSAPKMRRLEADKFVFEVGFNYRRLTVRECARVQGFPDGFIFNYKNVATGYKMIGNAVAVEFAKILAKSILNTLVVAKSTA